MYGDSNFVLTVFCRSILDTLKQYVENECPQLSNRFSLSAEVIETEYRDVST